MLPTTAQITDDGHLSVGGCDLVELAHEFGTPLYVFDEETLRGQCRAFLEAFRSRYPNTAVAYAAKAYLGRALAAIVAQEGLGANLPEDAIYPLNLGDSEGKPLDGAQAYTIHFDKADLPPADAFWSITLYDQFHFLAPNAIDRFSLGTRSRGLRFEDDGSLVIHVQKEQPDAGKVATPGESVIGAMKAATVTTTPKMLTPNCSPSMRAHNTS